eukprot:m.250681 g.250681  ORF g.250681 m.250681 type:complete len:247 (+) comp40324_c2_seq12:550-1290(+)
MPMVTKLFTWRLQGVCMPGVIQPLLDRGANIHAKTSQGEVHLYFAALHLHLDATKTLLDNVADINAVTFGQTPLFAAASQLDDHYRTKTCILVDKPLLSRDAVEVIRYFLGFPELMMNHQDGRMGMSALHLASLYGCFEAVELLLQAGAMTSLPSFGWGKRPIDIARDRSIRRLLNSYQELAVASPTLLRSPPYSNHLGRSVPPTLIATWAAYHDSMVQAAFTSIITAESLAESEWKQVTLPIKLN